MNNEQQLLRDPNIVPTGEVLAAELGTTNSVYTKFIEEIKLNGSKMKFLSVVFNVDNVN